jgi:ketosteroid isomerase-like protein
MRASLFIVAFVWAGCTTKVERTEIFDLEAVRKYIHEANQTYGDRFQNNEPAWYAERYTQDACALPPNEATVCGRDAIRAFNYNDGANAEIKIIITETAVYGNATEVIEEGTFDFPDGTGGSYDKGKFVAIWKQEDGKWKLFREIWNSDFAIE